MLNSLNLILPAVIPSWRFFSTVAPSPRIEYVIRGSATDRSGVWQEFRPHPDHVSFGRMLRRMIWNPRWNETLFLVSCAERLIAAPTEHSVVEIQTRVARDVMRGAKPPALTSRLYFRLVFLDREGADIIKSIEYVSGGVILAQVDLDDA